MNFNQLLAKHDIDEASVLVLRHTPRAEDGELREFFPQLAEEQPELFNAYQSTQTDKVERAMLKAKHVASFIGLEKRKGSAEDAAAFVGLYQVGAHRPLTRAEFWAVPEYKKMKDEYGMRGFGEQEDRTSVLWFDLTLTDFYEEWKGKLIIEWPRPAISWWRFANNAAFPIAAILEDSALQKPMPDWKECIFSRARLLALPKSWRLKMSQWRGIYYVFDQSDRKGYVGSAYGAENILGRWDYWVATGHGGNVHLRGRLPENLTFSILQLVAHDLEPAEVIKLENTWKDRLHTRTFGLNGN